MSNNSQLDSIKTKIQSLSHTEETNTKGGLLLYCEEKRSSFLGISYTSRQWKMANNGSLWLSIRM